MIANAELRDNSFTNSWFSYGNTFENASFYGSDFTSAGFGGADFDNASFYMATLSNTWFANANFIDSSFPNSTFSNNVIANAELRDNSFTNSQFNGGNFKDTVFNESVDLSNATFGNGLMNSNQAYAMLDAAHLDDVLINVTNNTASIIQIIEQSSNLAVGKWNDIKHITNSVPVDSDAAFFRFRFVE